MTHTDSAPTQEQQRLYKAYSRAYALEAHWSVAFLGIDIAFAIAGLSLAIASVRTPWLALFAFSWLLVRESPVFRDRMSSVSRRRLAVTIQEQFDLTFYSDAWTESWNTMRCGSPVRSYEIERLANAQKGSAVAVNYWVDTVGLPRGVGALLRVKQSAAWGTLGHRRYGYLTQGAVVIAALALALLAINLNLSFFDAIVLVAAPATPLLVGRMQSARHHLELGRRRDLLYEHASQALDAAEQDVSVATVRSAQDILYDLRMADRRIPQWLYLRFQPSDEASIDRDLAREADTLRHRWAALPDDRCQGAAE